MNNFSSYGETSGFSAIPAEKLELVNGGKGESSSSSECYPDEDGRSCTDPRWDPPSPTGGSSGSSSGSGGGK